MAAGPGTGRERELPFVGFRTSGTPFAGASSWVKPPAGRIVGPATAIASHQTAPLLEPPSPGRTGGLET